MTICYIGIGSNLGDRRKFINAAVDKLKGIAGIRVKRVSSIYETEPVGEVAQGKFLNGVLEIDTSLEPEVLLAELNRIEALLGRKREVPNGPRTIDLDILYYGDKSVRSEELTIPHPRLGGREFVLKGLRELGKA